ncbi:type II toxin-antitoxin system RelE/ParE family toxin [Novosphingobium pokkalii]|uniref:type II toxin-antitoxin system RelE/ParE family toxin n=1 Tax=Novosphingobium pokkalii TaxID=1770194 RepID=UPI00362D16C2
MPRFRLTHAAADDLAAIFLEGIEQFGLPQADAYHEGLGAIFAFLAGYPHAARLREEISPPVRAYPYKAHLVIYDVGVTTRSSFCASGMGERTGCPRLTTGSRRRIGAGHLREKGKAMGARPPGGESVSMIRASRPKRGRPYHAVHHPDARQAAPVREQCSQGQWRLGP